MIELLNNNKQNIVNYRNRATSILFAANASVNMLILYLTNRYINNFSAFERTWSDRLTADQLNAYFNQKDHFVLVGYFTLPFFLLNKYLVISFIIQLCTDFSGYKIPFRDVLRVVMTAELIFIVPAILRFVHFFNGSGYTLTELNQYQPFSLAGVFSLQQTSAWQFPMQTVSIWELAYWLLLADGISHLQNRSLWAGLKIVFYSYVPALAFWVLVVAFITFSLSK